MKLTKEQADDFVSDLRYLCNKFGGHLAGWDDGSVCLQEGLPDAADEFISIGGYVDGKRTDYSWDGKELS